MKEKLGKIINHYGPINQLKKLSEEIFEFQEAIIKYECGYLNEEHIIEEFADIMVLMEQFKVAYEIDNNKVIEIMKQKIDRQINRIKQEE